MSFWAFSRWIKLKNDHFRPFSSEYDQNSQISLQKVDNSSRSNKIRCFALIMSLHHSVGRPGRRALTSSQTPLTERCHWRRIFRDLVFSEIFSQDSSTMDGGCCCCCWLRLLCCGGFLQELRSVGACGRVDLWRVFVVVHSTRGRPCCSQRWDGCCLFFWWRFEPKRNFKLQFSFHFIFLLILRHPVVLFSFWEIKFSPERLFKTYYLVDGDGDGVCVCS